MPQTSDLVNDIKTVLDISSRVDERVKLIQVNQQELNGRLNQFISEFNQVTSRVSVLESKNGGRVHELEEEIMLLKTRFERMDAAGSSIFQKAMAESEENQDELEDKITSILSRLQMIEHANDSWQAKAKQYGGLIIQGIWVIVVCWLLWKFNLSTPPLP